MQCLAVHNAHAYYTTGYATSRVAVARKNTAGHWIVKLTICSVS
jgi:hypothetical protein